MRHGYAIEFLGIRNAVNLFKYPNNAVFTWSAELEKEFQDMKKAYQEAVKKLYAFVNSAMTVGTIPINRSNNLLLGRVECVQPDYYS